MENLKNIVGSVLKKLDERKQSVLVGRFGLNGKAPQTLQKIGDQYNVTRERIRQIESLALSESKKMLNGAEVKEILAVIDNYITEHGGAILEKTLVEDMQKELGKSATKANLSFLREATKAFGYKSESDDCQAFWFNNKESVQRAEKLIDAVAGQLKKNKEDILSRGKFDEIFAAVALGQNLKKEIGLGYLVLSKKFKVSPYGDFGLVEWPEVNPATIRDWSYLVLKKQGEPLHFSEIAKKIAGVHPKKRQVFTPTVHNELIKDKRFVLVGRGVYGLTEFGYETGSLKEVIVSLLKQKGAMSADKVVKLVSAQRMFKKNTIMLHLQDKGIFKKHNNGDYSVHEA